MPPCLWHVLACGAPTPGLPAGTLPEREQSQSDCSEGSLSVSSLTWTLRSKGLKGKSSRHEACVPEAPHTFMQYHKQLQH